MRVRTVSCETPRLLVSGTFDLFHTGHAALLNFANAISGGEFSVLVNGDEKLKGEKKTVQNEGERKNAVKAFCNSQEMRDASVDILNTKEDCLDHFMYASPCILLHGTDHNVETLSKIYGVEEGWWAEHRVYLIYKDRYPGVSSSQKRAEMKK